MSATPSYDPEQDEDLDFDLDFSGAQAANSPKKAMSPSSANGTAAKRKSNAPVVEEEIVVTLADEVDHTRRQHTGIGESVTLTRSGSPGHYLASKAGLRFEVAEAEEEAPHHVWRGDGRR